MRHAGGALTIACIWGQGSRCYLAVVFVSGNRVHRLASSDKGLAWFSRDSDEPNESSRIRESSPPLIAGLLLPPIIGTNKSDHFYWKAKLFDKVWENEVLQHQAERASIDHWPLILPLILLSAYLILWKPRKKSA